MFEDFEAASPSLVELLLKAQVLAAQGEVARARDALGVAVENYAAREYVARWRTLLRSLDLRLESLSVTPAREARLLLLTWEKQVKGMIPEARGTLLILPLPTLEEVEKRRSQGLGREVKVYIPSAEDIRSALVEAQLARRSGTLPEGSEVERRDYIEMVEAFLAAALRLRDFRADALRRVRSGDFGGVLSEGLIRDGELVFVENERRRVAFYRQGDSGGDGTTGGASIPCGRGAWLWVE